MGSRGVAKHSIARHIKSASASQRFIVFVRRFLAKRLRSKCSTTVVSEIVMHRYIDLNITNADMLHYSKCSWCPNSVVFGIIPSDCTSLYCPSVTEDQVASSNALRSH
jgi:hypothetical protein